MGSDEGKGGGAVSRDEAERREAQDGAAEATEGSGPGARWDRLTGVGPQHRAGRAAEAERRARDDEPA